METALAEKTPGEISHAVHSPLTPMVDAESDPMLAMIERVALNPDADVEKMQALLDMRRGEEDRVAERGFYQAMTGAQGEMGAVLRDRDNDQTRSRYATLEAIAKAIRPIWTKHGFAMSFGSADCPKEGFYRVTCRVSHGLGHYRDYHADVPVDAAGIKGNVNKTATHAFGSTMSYGRRYLTMLIFDIATSDDDDGQKAGAGETINAGQYQALIALIEEKGIDKDAFLELINIKGANAASLQEIWSADFDKIMDTARAKKVAS